LAAIVLGRIEREREMACDDFVVAQTGSARSYARSLAHLHDLRWSTGTRLLATGILGRNSSLGDRIESLLRRGREFSARPSLASLGVSAFLLALLLTAGGLVPGWVAIAQTNAATPKFEVASIKPAKPQGRGVLMGTRSRPNDGRFDATNVTLRMLIRTAYDIQNSQIAGGPNWIGHDRFDIQAKSDSAVDDYLQKLTPAQGRLVKQCMLQALLADRFNLKLRRETRELPIYALVVAKHGPKIQADQNSTPGPSGIGGAHASVAFMRMPGQEQQIYFREAPLQFLGQVLSQQLGRTVVDKTGLKGNYSFILKYMPDISRGQMFGGPGPGGAGGIGAGPGASGGGPSAAGMPPASNSSDSSSDASGPSVFTAVQQQLGLRLKPEKGPVEVLVIDRVEQPSAN
jgi:uncharacterized protein (TIGR03435 family)